MSNQAPTTDDCDSMLFSALRIARVPASVSNKADREVREMAGSNVFVRLDALDKRMDDIIRFVQWGFGAIITFFSLVFGYAFTVIHSMLQRMMQ